LSSSVTVARAGKNLKPYQGLKQSTQYLCLYYSSPEKT